jgi:hypothetical protein
MSDTKSGNTGFILPVIMPETKAGDCAPLVLRLNSDALSDIISISRVHYLSTVNPPIPVLCWECYEINLTSIKLSFVIGHNAGISVIMIL